MTKEQNRTIWILILSSSLILAITMGVRQSLGLFVAPIITPPPNNLKNQQAYLTLGC